MKERKVRTTSMELMFSKGPKGPKGQHNKISGSISKINGRLRAYMTYQNITSRRLKVLEEYFDEMILYVIEHGQPFLNDQYSMMWSLDKECETYYMMRVEWIK